MALQLPGIIEIRENGGLTGFADNNSTVLFMHPEPIFECEYRGRQVYILDKLRRWAFHIDGSKKDVTLHNPRNLYFNPLDSQLRPAM